ncbi:MAG: succinylglutamate desuccinylase/aspartoacylase family protein, partial [Phycisphaerales bacterium]|nr:succinylglutamate desuccinylase/aspartoacylase family protein [Phycisphaerales bacterium]
MHGNEPAGLLAAERVLATLPETIHGTFMVVAGNRRALARRHRAGAADLNRRFTPEHIDRVRRYGPADDEDLELVELLDVFAEVEAPAFVL